MRIKGNVNLHMKKRVYVKKDYKGFSKKYTKKPYPLSSHITSNYNGRGVFI